MAVPKRRKSRARTRIRRSKWKADPPDLVPIELAGRRYLVPRAQIAAYRRGLLPPPE